MKKLDELVHHVRRVGVSVIRPHHRLAVLPRYVGHQCSEGPAPEWRERFQIVKSGILIVSIAAMIRSGREDSKQGSWSQARASVWGYDGSTAFEETRTSGGGQLLPVCPAPLQKQSGQHSNLATIR